MASIDQIRELREQTGVSITECKKALEETGNDFEKAKVVLRKWGKELAGKKSSREVRQGIIESYVHPNKKVGVLLDIRCETDFVAKSKDFHNLAHELCLHIAAMKPLFLSEKDIPAEQMKDEELCLFSQVWIKDDQKTIKDLINDYIARLGENIIIKQFSRFEI